MKVQKIHDTEFTTFTSEENPLSALKPKSSEPGDSDPPAEGAPAPRKIDVVFGQVDSLLIVSSSAKAIEKILSRQSGGLTPASRSCPLSKSI